MMEVEEADRLRCRSCGKAWVDHDGIIQTCATVERVRALLANWQRSLKNPYGIWDRATKVRELQAALDGTQGDGKGE